MSDLVADTKFDAAMARLAHEESLLMKPSKVLRAAADILDKGWCQGSLGMQVLHLPEYGASHQRPVSAEGFQPGVEIDRVCVMGALMKALVDLYGEGWPVLEAGGGVLDYQHRTPAQRAMVSTYALANGAVEQEVRMHYHSFKHDPILIAMWNDWRDVTQADVVGMVRGAAAREEEAGR